VLTPFLAVVLATAVSTAALMGLFALQTVAVQPALEPEMLTPPSLDALALDTPPKSLSQTTPVSVSDVLLACVCSIFCFAIVVSISVLVSSLSDSLSLSCSWSRCLSFALSVCLSVSLSVRPSVE
jgi:hypothetical protein